jgi:prephenate dehydrogenase
VEGINKRTIVIIGMGLIGGSLGLALRRFARAQGRPWRVIGLGRRERPLRWALRRGACDEVSMDWRQMISRADDIVICTPPAQIVPVTEKIASWVRTGTVISDAGSIKEPILAGWSRLKKKLGRSGVSFSLIGAHPMAGSEASGIENARADIFQGAMCAVTPCPGEPASAVARVERIWKACGARPFRVGAAAHDRAVSLTSHLPHLVASALMLSLMEKRKAEPLTEKFVARSFLDLTRVAASDPALWAGIFRMNRASLKAALGSLESAVRRLCDGKGTERLLRATAAARRQWSS